LGLRTIKLVKTKPDAESILPSGQRLCSPLTIYPQEVMIEQPSMIRLNALRDAPLLHLASDFECVKCHEVRCNSKEASRFKPACLVGITPAKVWRAGIMQIVSPPGRRSTILTTAAS
jgi:hypothetical protein